MRISARNQLPATVKNVTEGQVMAEVSVDVDGGHEVVAAITAESGSAFVLGARQARRRRHQVPTEVMLAVDD